MQYVYFFKTAESIQRRSMRFNPAHSHAVAVRALTLVTMKYLLELLSQIADKIVRMFTTGRPELANAVAYVDQPLSAWVDAYNLIYVSNAFARL